MFATALLSSVRSRTQLNLSFVIMNCVNFVYVLHSIVVEWWCHKYAFYKLLDLGLWRFAGLYLIDLFLPVMN